ncbi:lytic murein transglycosylase [Bradyrhizobium sp.]|uniref:lytic murein transglycosylase n=1 Tax=Bradyrhizobium sp. TaxID=376 RepID=UPI001D808DE3|nr:lytic murein transglycosylase [Bradyrhizobium sp.]MBV8699161.1 lytic murein transglycosylase [Bradyrhizobium sp.]MBV8916674.1 lytic murein transglycosylase [Bradyrhizobium sp.]
MKRALAFVSLIATVLLGASARAADADFAKFIASLWPDAQAAGVSRATFDRETAGLEADYKLPDLILPGRPATGAPRQAEFVQVPADYIREAAIARLAEQGQRLMQQYRPALNEIETRFGVPGPVVLAIWGRETDFGRYTLPYDGLRVLATQAYVGRRKDQYRNEFILGLKMLGDGVVARKDFRASWGGAVGLTQFLPSEYSKHGVDLDGDGKVDLWHSVPDALGSAAKQLVDKGWQSGLRWAYEVKAPANVDCTMGVPEVTRPIGDWLHAGFVPVRGQKIGAAEQAQEASLLQPEGIQGPAFLTTKNYFVIKEYNFSDLYVLFVGHLADRMTNPLPFATPWSATTQLRTADVEAMQRELTRLGLYKDKLDGKAGMLTRAAVGAFQKKAGLKLDCWPSGAVLQAMRAAR